MQISFKVDYKPLTKAFLEEMPRQLPFAAARTLTMLANDTRKALVKELPIAFDRPTNFTLKGPTATKATKESQTSSVEVPKSEMNDGKSKNEHIRPGAKGASQRHQKKTEWLLTQLGVLPAGWVTVPGSTMKLDANGNLSGRTYRSIVNTLQLKVNTKYASSRGITGKSQARAKRLGVPVEMFAVVPGSNSLAKGGGWLPPGVYRHMPGRKLQQMLKFVRQAKYEQRLDLDQIANEVIGQNLQTRFDESIALAMATAIKRAK